MKRQVSFILIFVTIVAVTSAGRAPALAAAPIGSTGTEYEIVAGELAMRPGMYVSFRRIVENIVTDLRWQVTVQSVSYPDWVDISWLWPRSDGSLPSPTLRKIEGLSRSRTFGPIFGLNDPRETDRTAPWVSTEVLRELRTGKVAYNFKLGTASVTGLFASDLKVEEEVLFPIELNGRQVYLPAYKCAKGQITIWNNMQNPLVLEYKPIGLPLVTGVFGWKAESMSI